jgi:transcriptional regulator with XRE-family HTH domain
MIFMNDLRSLRELADWTQTRVARVSGINRAKLSLVECGEIELSAGEEAAVRRVLTQAIQQRSAQLRAVLEEAMPVSAGAPA